MKSHLKKNKVRINLDLAGKENYIFASPQQLSQVFLNLINNAVDAINGAAGANSSKEDPKEPPGGVITFNLKREENSVVIEVTDTGKGIAEEDLRHLFDPFFTRKKRMGMGVGLSICHGIIEENKGTISARNLDRGGAAFTIILPTQ